MMAFMGALRNIEKKTLILLKFFVYLAPNKQKALTANLIIYQPKMK